MAGKADIRVYFESDGEFARVFQVKVDRRGELYTFTHGWPISIKDSHHSSGYTKATITDRNLQIRTDREPQRPPLAGVDGFEYITGIGGGAPPDPELGLRSKSESRKAGRRSLVVPSPEYMWGCDVWAVSPERKGLGRKIASTPPYEKSKVLGRVLVDWLAPMVLVTVWAATTKDAYEFFKISPAPEGRVPIVQAPRPWQNTWLEPYFREHSDGDDFWGRVADEISAGRDPLEAGFSVAIERPSGNLGQHRA